ncbi:MAG TPA: malto-oligosyltrehalose synthase [Bacteroidales bacterium]|nr:malto-oligosyltrehalose synthase [Bacteroidales bacterium]
MFNPVSTYRIQFNRDFTFSDFLENLEYFDLLGVSTIYASPVFSAVPGSMHGYDVTDPLEINPEIGNYDELRTIQEWRSLRNIGWLQDIVPNHMAFHSNNKWLMDVLEFGSGSKYADFFDIDLKNPGFDGKLMVPFLGKKQEEAIREHEIAAGWKNGNFHVKYFDFIMPSSPEASAFLMRETFKNFFSSALNSTGIALYSEWEGMKADWEKNYKNDPVFKTSIDSIIDSVNKDATLMEHFLSLQKFMLCYWKESLEKINYRRFFTINSLICLATENDTTFDKYHQFIGDLVSQGIVTGLRIDHIDGLKRPLYYLEKLKLLTDNSYIISEKILGLDEEIQDGLMANGTSGYDYLGIVNNLFTYKKNYDLLKRFYAELTGINDSVEDIAYINKKMILSHSMNGEWENLTRLFDECGYLKSDPEISHDSVRSAIGELLICFPVYKIYPEYNNLTVSEEACIQSAYKKASLKNPVLIQSLNLVKDILINEKYWNKEGDIPFSLRFFQFTGPLMAKGVEDTVMYYYNCFIAHNEVGDSSGSEGFSISDYHDHMIRRRRNIPFSLNSTSTHDTKRGEDVRARLNVLSEMADEWISKVRSWSEINTGFRTIIKGKPAPDRNEEYLIYQTIVGAFPVNMQSGEQFLSRIDAYLIKALREAKMNSDWNAPDEDYEKAVINFTRNILEPGSVFLKSFLPFHKTVARYGIINSLSQLVLKATSPGIPDFYQGTEVWDLSLVDPDNRRKIDYRERYKLLSELTGRQNLNDPALIPELSENLTDGRMKLWLTHTLMNLRKADPGLFTHGTYLPLEVTGKKKENVIAYARVYKNSWLIVVAPLYISILTSGKKSSSEISWKDTAVKLPGMYRVNLQNVITGLNYNAEGSIMLSEIMKRPFPVILKGERLKPARSAGVLLHISSLPGDYGIGDLGSEAYKFADILNRNGQEYWQILPFNPIDEGYAWSPYSSASAFAGNILFISPEMLVRSGFVKRKTAQSLIIPETGKTDFKNALKVRMNLIDEAFSNFFENKRPFQQNSFRMFCENEKYWLDDYSLFRILKTEFRNKPWYDWPLKFKERDHAALDEYRKKHETEILKEQFGQFLFQEQWKALKEYCNNQNIKIIGDMSFYVNYDSADIWSHPGYFKLDDKKVPKKVAGVPPDYFSETGQLWNMPVYNWEKLSEDDFSWWVKRIQRNIELCDVVRFDHFRGFSEYWEVNFGEKTAINGEWVNCPGEKFFNKIKEIYPEMPFIAEDLGTIDDKVRKLRDDFGLPGMSIIQFAFGDNTPGSEYIPHNNNVNTIVYTGTHDNNTTKGWFADELSEKGKAEAGEYAGHRIRKDSCHIDFIRMAYSSVAKIAIIPAQDIIGLGNEARLNKPSTTGNNWKWKMKKINLKEFISPEIRKIGVLYGRI